MFFSENSSARLNSARKLKPSPAMKRKLQNIGATCGMVSHAALSTMAGVAWRTSATYFFSNRPKPRSAWRASNAAFSCGFCGSRRSTSSAITASRPFSMRVLFLATIWLMPGISREVERVPISPIT